jgi:hypothetical protein
MSDDRRALPAGRAGLPLASSPVEGPMHKGGRGSAFCAENQGDSRSGMVVVRGGGGVLAGLHFKLVDHLLHVGDGLGQFAGLFLLSQRLYRALEGEGAVLGVGFDVLVIEILVTLDLGLEVVLDGAVGVGGDGLRARLFAGGTNADLIGDGIAGCVLLGDGLGLALLVLRFHVAGECDDSLVAVLRDVDVPEVAALERGLDVVLHVCVLGVAGVIATDSKGEGDETGGCEGGPFQRLLRTCSKHADSPLRGLVRWFTEPDSSEMRYVG